MDAGEVPLTIFTLVGGVKFGLIALLVKELLSLTVSGSNPFGLLADFLACGSFLTACWLIYKDRTSFRIITFVTMVVIATLTRLLVVVPVNLLVLRLQFGTCPKEVMKMMVWILPFNGIKAIFTALCAYLLLPKLQKSLSKYFAG
jgi:riboflavin transporter FmnP